MSNSVKPIALDKMQKVILILTTLFLSILLIFFRVSFGSRAPLDQLVSNSMELNVAFSNRKPTVVEFYADWCESCKQMAPIMLRMESKYSDEINFVMLNVDNNLWKDLIEKYEVKGIPQLNFLDQENQLKGKEIGFRNAEQLDKLFNALLLNKELSEVSLNLGLTNLERQSLLTPQQNQKIVQPRSHG